MDTVSYYIDYGCPTTPYMNFIIEKKVIKYHQGTVSSKTSKGEL